MQADTLRDAVAALVLNDIPKLLTLLDRTPVSPTYGCFDRAYWHYRMIDFPCGMSQEFVLPLALVWSMPDLPGNEYYQDPLIRDFVIAGIRYAARSAHPDGSCDDYYPFERAAGARPFPSSPFLKPWTSSIFKAMRRSMPSCSAAPIGWHRIRKAGACPTTKR